MNEVNKELYKTITIGAVPTVIMGLVLYFFGVVNPSTYWFLGYLSMIPMAVEYEKLLKGE